MGRFFGYENIPPVTKASGTSLTLATTYLGQPTIVKVGGQAYTPSSTVTLNTGTTGINGIDTGTFTANTLYYVYAVVSGGVLGLIISTTAPSTGPTGFTSAYKYLAKFRTLVGSAAIADVNSIWVGASQDQSGAAIGEWQTFTMSITGAISNPTKATTTVTDSARWRRVGSHMEIMYDYVHTSNAGAAAGNGFYLFGLPSGYTIDTTKQPVSAGSFAYEVGNLYAYDGSSEFTGIVQAFNTTNLNLYVYTTISVTQNVSQARIPLNSSAVRYSFRASVPIAEWAGVFTAD